MELKGSDALAFEYAITAAEVSGETDTREDFAATVQALVAAPDPRDLQSETMPPELTLVLTEWERRHGDPSDGDEGIASVAHSVASSMMESIGFIWT